MADFDDPGRSSPTATAGMAMLLLQLAASRAEIGPFARRGRETPQMAARLYGIAAAVAAGRASRRA